jgi:hypothetical protein
VDRPIEILPLVVLAPPSQHGVPSADHKVAHDLLGWDPRGDGSASEPDAGAQLEDIGEAEWFAEQPDLPAGRVQKRRGQLQQGRLARAVGPENHPPLVQFHCPGHVVQQGGRAPDDTDRVHLDHDIGRSTGLGGRLHSVPVPAHLPHQTSTSQALVGAAFRACAGGR